jgi:two-component system, LytTR family, response regulator
MFLNSLQAVSQAQTLNPSIRTVIAGSESLSRRKLRSLVDAVSGIHVVSECQNGKEVLSAIRSLQPALLLLDVHLLEESNLKALSKAEELPEVIFTSANDPDTVRSLESLALGYLPRPFAENQLHQAIDRARVALQSPKENDISQRLADLLSRLRNRPQSTPELHGRLVIKARGRVVFLNLDDIDWVEAAANYVRLNVGKESYHCRETISRTSERLNPNHFIRIHRSTIVNVRKIKELIPVNSGEYIVVLNSGKELSCSRGYRTFLKRIIEKNL